MQKLKHITFTGVDGKTDLGRMYEIQQKYPIVEWGVLVAKNWRENGNRYFNPSYLSALDGTGLKLSAHMCGSIARAAVQGDFNPFFDWSRGYCHMFNRCQLNISTSKENPAIFKYERDISDYFDEVILQQKSVRDCELYVKSKLYRIDEARKDGITSLIGAVAFDRITMLLDASGGLGIDTPIEVYPTIDKVGYAGGMNADNVAEKLEYLLTNENVGDFWIDMETGVRTEDWFDLDKVEKVLEACQEVINKQ
jgi:hypothetical protein